MYLTTEQRAALRVAAKSGIHEVDRVVFLLRTNHPAAFHDSESLKERELLIEPPQYTPCHGFVRRPPKQEKLSRE